MRRIPLTLVAALTAAAATFTAVPAGATGALASAPAERAAQSVRTSFGFQGTAFGTQVTGGQVPVGSDRTGQAVLSCTNRAGLVRTNKVASATLPGVGTLQGVSTRVFTTKRGRNFTTTSRHDVARLVLADSPLGSLSVEGLRSVSKAYNRKGVYGSSTETAIAKLVFTPPQGEAQVLPLPTPNQPVEIPGLATISVGTSEKLKGRSYAIARASALEIKIIPTDTLVRVARSYARIDGGITNGLYGGYSAGLEGSLLAGTVGVGRLPNQTMPCAGTSGRRTVQRTASVDLGGQVVVRGVAANVRTVSRPRTSLATGQGKVARISLAGGRVVVLGIVGQSNVRRTAKGLQRSDTGTTVGSVIVDGERQSFPRTGVIEVPGLLKLQSGVIRKYKFGMKSIGLRVTLLDGTGAVLDLGVSKALVRPSGVRARG